MYQGRLGKDKKNDASPAPKAKADAKKKAAPSENELKGLRQAASKPKFCKFYAAGKCERQNCPDPHLNKSAREAVEKAKKNIAAAKSAAKKDTKH